MAIGLLVYAAFQLIFTGAESGKKTAIHAIVGLLVLLLSYGIMQFVFEMIK
jgi:hypothetical protein